MSIRHWVDDFADQRFTRYQKVVECDRLPRHADEATLELSFDVFAARRKHLSHGPVVADEVDEKGPPQRVVDAFVCQEVARIEEVTWMLPVECGDDLPGVEIWKGDNPHFRETKLVFDAGGDRTNVGFEHAASQDRRDLDF